MVEVHKEVLARLGEAPEAVFLDTPAGFQLNCDQLSERAAEYFGTRVRHPMSIVSFKSRNVSAYESEMAFKMLRKADFVLIGPGSPTYAVRQWEGTPVPEILTDRIKNGGCLVAASAAVLTVGRMTIPVYEIYKVGTGIHWIEGVDILGAFGFNYAVIPHWNNAEGGTHDTRRCFMGEARFRVLSSMLTKDVGVFGLDEHTACIIDLETDEAEVCGIGAVTIRHGDRQKRFSSGERFPLEALRQGARDEDRRIERPEPAGEPLMSEEHDGAFWHNVHTIEGDFHRGLEHDPRVATNALLELDRAIWKAKQDLESEEFISQAREIFREMIVLLGTRLLSGPLSWRKCLAPLVDELLSLRLSLRKEKRWYEADAVRDSLSRAGIVVEDTDEGSRWHLKE